MKTSHDWSNINHYGNIEVTQYTTNGLNTTKTPWN